MKCIICELEKAESEEHIVPETLGNKEFTISRVCKACNDKLGSKVDNKVNDHPLVKVYRKKNGLLGKKNKQIKILEGKVSDLETGRAYSLKDGIPLLIPQIVEMDNEKIVVEASSFKDGVDYYRKKLKRDNCPDDKIESILKNAYCAKSLEIKPTFPLHVVHNYKILSMEAIKIAYESTFLLLGEYYLADKLAVLYRAELFRAINANDRDIEVSEELSRLIAFPNCNSWLQDLLYEHRKQIKSTHLEVCHSIFFIKEGNSLYCIINLFNSDLFSWAVKVSDNIQSYSNNLQLLVFLILKGGTLVKI